MGEKDVNTPVRHNMPRKSVFSEELKTDIFICIILFLHIIQVST